MKHSQIPEINDKVWQVLSNKELKKVALAYFKKIMQVKPLQISISK